MKTKTIVFGDDGSPAADVAWLQINSQVWPNWRVEIARVEIQMLPGKYTYLHRWDPETPRTVFDEAMFTEVVNLKADGDPRLVLSRPCDLLVIGPRGPGLLKALHLGSTADWLLAHPPSPLLIAHHGSQVTEVLLCADGSVHANKVATALGTFPWLKQTHVTVLCVDDGRVNVGAATAAVAKQLETVDATLTVRVHTGNPTNEIKNAIEQLTPDLVAMGTRGLTGLRHLRVGSTASAITRTADCSVLVACDDD
jgi:nucleotide-binding universal stress UspA family protein